jgi:rod shape determining protein RodA
MRGIKNNTTGVGDLDYTTLTCYVALVVIGWVMIYAVNYQPNSTMAFFDMGNNAGKQLFFMVVCIVLLFFIQMSDWVFWRSFALPIYIVSMVFLAGTIFLGREVNGANAWYQFGGFSFQPSEIAKFSTCLAMAGYLSSTGVSLRDPKTRLYAFGLFLLPIAIILLQKDMGSALVFFSFMLALYREGLPTGWYLIGFGTALMLILGLMFPWFYVVAVLLMVVSFRLIKEHRNTRPWWIAFALVVPTIIWWPEVSQWLVTTASGTGAPTDSGLLHPDSLGVTGAVSPPASANAKAAAQAPAVNALFVTILPLLLFIAIFLTGYIRKNSMIQRRLQITLLLLSLGSGLVFLSSYAYTFMAPHQQQRIRIWLNPSDAAADARGSAYNLLHSKMAIGSGGLFGKGAFQGNMTKLKYVPEQTTDFIFCTIGEEHGFVGVLGVIGLFTVLLYRITQLAERQRSNFSRVYAYGVAGVIFVHFFVNIGMTMGVFPIIGIPLPFISYGGSSLIGFTLMIGVLLKLDSHRNLA